MDEAIDRPTTVPVDVPPGKPAVNEPVTVFIRNGVTIEKKDLVEEQHPEKQPTKPQKG